MNREDILRGCMIKSASEGLKVIRKLMNIGRSDISSKTGISEDTLSDIEVGRTQLSESGYVALSAFFDNFFAHFSDSDKHTAIRRNLVKEVLDIDYEDSELPKWYCLNVQKVFENMSFLEKWFASFEDVINQLHAEREVGLTDDEINLLVENYNIFIDETIIRDKNFSEFIAKFTPFLSSEDRQEKIFIARNSIEKLDDEAASALKYDNILGIFDAAGTLEEIFIGNPENRFILITSNQDLAESIILSPNTELRKSPVLVAYLYTNGNIALYDKDFSKVKDPEEDMSHERFDGKEDAASDEYEDDEENYEGFGNDNEDDDEEDYPQEV